MNQGGVANAVLGGWSTNWIVTLQGGQPLDFGCHTGDNLGSGLQRHLVPGRARRLGIKVKTRAAYHGPFWIGNPSAFTQPCQLGELGSTYSDYRIGAQLRSVDRCRGTGRQTRSDLGTGISTGLISRSSRISVQREVLRWSSARSSSTSSTIRTSTPNFGGNGVVAVGGSGDYTKRYLRSNRIHPRRSIRSAADPVCVEAVLLEPVRST